MYGTADELTSAVIPAKAGIQYTPPVVIEGAVRAPVVFDNGNDLVIDGERFTVLSEREPGNLPWGDLGVDIVFEATGLFRKRPVRRSRRSARGRTTGPTSARRACRLAEPRDIQGQWRTAGRLAKR